MMDDQHTHPLLVFAVTGRIGSGSSFVRDKLKQCLATFGYDAEIIDITRLFIEQASFKGDNEASIPESISERVSFLQDRGNELRKQYGNDVIAKLAINEFIRVDLEKRGILENGTRQAYIIDSLRHPAEVACLREVFGSSFYLVGAVANEIIRRTRMQERKGFDSESFARLSTRDANEHGISYGQRTVATVVSSDYFFRNDYSTKEEISQEANRFLNMVFGVSISSPRREEYGMHMAFQAAARSACLSRQVGAAIFDKYDNVLATGHNDVPKVGGGLYDGNSASLDQRCWTRAGKCYNDEEKEKIVEELSEALQAAGFTTSESNEGATMSLRDIIYSSRIKTLLEFTRAVHAEMDAIITVARTSAPGIVGSTLYVTTYPCHVCAKHIVAAGIERVVYLEPYEKSLATQLHADSIVDSSSVSDQGSVQFQLYGGVAPSRYNQFFKQHSDRKTLGKYIDKDRQRATLLPHGPTDTDMLRVRLDRIHQDIESRIERQDIKEAQDNGQ